MALTSWKLESAGKFRGTFSFREKETDLAAGSGCHVIDGVDKRRRLEGAQAVAVVGDRQQQTGSMMNCSAQQHRSLVRFPDGACLDDGGRSMLALQPAWDLLRTQAPLLRSPFFPALFSFAVYSAFCLPFAALDCLSRRVPALRAYKIQQLAAPPTLGMMALCLAQSVYHHVVCIFPATVVHWYWRPVSLPATAPALPSLLLQVAVCLLLFDALSFFWHLLHHRVPWLYRTFHKVHHKHVSTFALTTQYSSMWELLWLGMFAATIPLLLRCHPLTEMTFFVANIWLSVEDHSGYDLPWSTHRLVPFGLYGGAPHHDLHHLKFRFNYAPYFTHWDRLFGTLGQAAPGGESGGAAAKRAKD